MTISAAVIIAGIIMLSLNAYVLLAGADYGGGVWDFFAAGPRHPGVVDSDELAQRRQALPWVRIDRNYRFETDEGSASLTDLFQGRTQLLVYHFMFGPDYTATSV